MGRSRLTSATLGNWWQFLPLAPSFDADAWGTPEGSAMLMANMGRAKVVCVCAHACTHAGVHACGELCWSWVMDHQTWHKHNATR